MPWKPSPNNVLSFYFYFILGFYINPFRIPISSSSLYTRQNQEVIVDARNLNQ